MNFVDATFYRKPLYTTQLLLNTLDIKIELKGIFTRHIIFDHLKHFLFFRNVVFFYLLSYVHSKLQH